MSPHSRPVTLGELPRALGARWRRVAAVSVPIFLLLAAYILLSPPRYRSEALLRVQSKSPGEGLLGSLDEVSGLGAIGLGRDEVETEVGVLSSRRMQDAAIEANGLEAVMTRPRRRPRAGIVQVKSNGESVLEGTLKLRRTSGQQWSASADWTRGSAPVPSVVSEGTSFQVGTLSIAVQPGAAVDEIDLKLLPRYKVHEMLDDRLQVRRRSPGAKLIEVRYVDIDRQLAAGVVQSIVDSYLTFVASLETGDAGRTVGSIRRSADSVSRALRTADESLRDYQASSRLVAPTEQATLQVRRVAALRTQLDQIEVERDALQRLLAIVDKRSQSGSDASAYRQLATFPALITNRAIQDLLGTLISLENERSRLSVSRTAGNESVKAITARIQELERDLRQLCAQYLESLDQQMRESSQSLARMTQDLGAMPAAEMRYVRLARDRTVLGETWVILQKQLRQAELQESLRQDRVRLVDPPRVPQPGEKIFPRPVVHLPLAFVVALLAGIAAGLVGLRAGENETDGNHLAVRPAQPIEEAGSPARGNGPPWR